MSRRQQTHQQNMTKDSLVKVLQAQMTESESSQAETGEQRERNHRYYAVQPLGNEERGRSQYIDPVVFSSVESKKSIFTETFLSSREVVRFSGNGESELEAKAKTAYAQRTMRKNKYVRMFRDGWHDSLVAKKMTCWLDWEQDTKTVELKFQGAPSAHVMAQVKQLGIVREVNTDNLQSYEVPPQGGANVLMFPGQQQQRQYVHTGTLSVELDDSYVSIDLIQPEFVFSDPQQSYCDEKMWNSKRRDVSKLVLIDEGYDPEQVSGLVIDNTYGSTEEDRARKSYDKGNTTGYASAMQRISEQDEVTVYCTRTWMSLKEGDIEGYVPETEEMRLYEIYWNQNEILRYAAGEESPIDEETGEPILEPAIREIDEMAVYDWTELKVSHASEGLCTADLEAHQQKTGSMLKRGVMDNMSVTNNPRYEAVLDNVHNERDLEDNVIGAVIDVEQLGTVQGLNNPQLSPIVMGVMQMLQQDSEERSGVSGLAKGMNQGAVNNQNADDMIARLTNAGMRRVAMAARDWAQTFLVPMMQCIVRLGTKYDESQDVLESGGRQIPIVPGQWNQDSEDMEIAVALTPDEAQAMAKQMLLMHNVQAADEELKPLYGVNQRHAMMDTIYELIGIVDSTPFLAPPEGEQMQQHKQGQQQQFQMVMQDKKNAEMAQQRQEQFQQWVISQQLEQGWAQQNNKMLDTEEDNDLAREQYETDTYFRGQELELEAEQERPVATG